MHKGRPARFASLLLAPIVALACGDEASTPLDAGAQPGDAAVTTPRLDAGEKEAAVSTGDAGDAGLDGAAPVSGDVTLTGGNQHTCAITSGQGVACWGSNVDGQLGDSRATPVHFTPFVIPALTGVRALTAGRDHTCALLNGGSVKCWGINSNGELGDGTKAQRVGPVAVVGLTDAVEVRSFWGHTCARRSGGGIRCWGANSGAFGDGTTGDSPTPVDTSGITASTSVAVGWGHTCAVVAGGTAKCWGHYNNWGQIGDGTTAMERLLPVDVVQLSGVAAVTNGSYHSCARLSDGTVSCWGNNQGGALGLGTTDSDRHTAVVVPGLAGVAQVSAGSAHTCARTSANAVYCWGSGPIGDGVNTIKPSPTAVRGLTDAVEIASGEDHACARRASGKVVCWGSDYGGQLGDDAVKADKLAPVDVVGL